MKAYLFDLQERVAAACGQSRAKAGAVTGQFSILVSFVEKLLRRQRISGSAAAPIAGRPRAWGAFALSELGVCASSSVPSRRVAHLAGRPRRARREPGHAGAGGAGAGLATKKECPHR